MSGFVVWMTGLSGAGKSTLASRLTQELSLLGVHVECLDGDEVRKNLSHGLGFSREDRDHNVRRIGYVARMVARAGSCAITAAISPYRALRDEIRNKTENFVEVYCECPLEVLTERDPKGLYKRALAGELKNFTGVDDPYEAPQSPEVSLRTDLLSPEQCIDKILSVLKERGLLATHHEASSPHPAPFGAEVFEARAVGEKELRQIEKEIPIDLSLRDHTLAVARGYFCPVSGFMTEREAVKVAKLRALETGTPWWDRPFTLPLPKGMEVVPEEVARLSFEGVSVAAVRIEQVWSSETGQRHAAGPIDAVNPEVAPGISARSLRRKARERGVGRITCLFAAKEPSPEGLIQVGAASALSDQPVVIARADVAPSWIGAVSENVVVISLPQEFPFEDERARLVVQKSLGGSASLLIV